ncbi:hypothetical protein KACHI17_03590 [Sediminibacterium sp. KACHI17]|jgi:hypothetical protein|uniref:DUF4345 domain-containing protein n=1 Tax=Sediminibacterium sp. KACHI17 TaxID=1751071 RepID=A0AAT9GFL8_9BACT
MQKKTHWILYLSLSISGVLVLWLYAILFTANDRVPGTEYYYSGTLNDGFNIYTGVLFFLIGIIVGYFSNANIWMAGISSILCLPLIALYEATIYKGSHNLIPFELLFYFAYSLPAVAGTYLGKKIPSRFR